MKAFCAGAAALMLSSSAWGSVVYVPNGSGLWQTFFPPDQPPPRDVNADGVPDLGFVYFPWAYQQDHGWYYSDNATGGSGFSAAPMDRGTPVGPGTSFDSGRQLGQFSVNWLFKPPHYVQGGALDIPEGDSYWGLKFVGPGGVVSYGWLRYRGHIDLTPPPPGGTVMVQIIDYAYETQPGVPLPVGAVPAPGGAVLVGVLGALSVRRSRRRGRA